MSRLFRTTACLALALAYVTAAADAAVNAGPSDRVRRFLGDAAADVIGGASRVEVFALTGERAKEDAPGVGGYAIRAAGKEQGDPFARGVAAVLFDEKTYLFDAAKACIFQPGVGYRLWKGEQRVEVIFCFTCDELVVFSPPATDGSVRSAGEDFDPARSALVRLAKEALPEDAEIQALVETK